MGDAFPSVAQHAFDRPAELVWVTGEDDLFACRSVADAIRDGQRRGILDVPVTVVATGREDWTRALVRRHRIDAAVLPAPPETGATHAQRGTGSVYLLHHGRIAAHAPASDTASLRAVFQRSAAIRGDAPAPAPVPQPTIMR